jgi:hypothetical protein
VDTVSWTFIEEEPRIDAWASRSTGQRTANKLNKAMRIARCGSGRPRQGVLELERKRPRGLACSRLVRRFDSMRLIRTASSFASSRLGVKKKSAVNVTSRQDAKNAQVTRLLPPRLCSFVPGRLRSTWNRSVIPASPAARLSYVPANCWFLDNLSRGS